MKPLFRNILIFFAVVLLLAAAWYFRSIVVYILVSGVLSIMGRPLVDLFSSIRIRKWGFPRTLAALLTLIIIWGLIILFFLIFVPLVTKQINYFSTLETEKIVSLVEKPIKFIEDLIRSVGRNMNSDFSVQEFINQKLSEILDIEKVKGFLGSLLGVLGNIAVAVFSITFITFFFLKDQHLFFESILMWVPDKYTEGFTHALYSIKNLLTRYFIGILIQCTCVMILIDIGMTIAGIDFQQALVMGLIIGILNVIPYIGPWLGFFITIVMGVASHVNQDFTTVVVPLVYFMTAVVAITQLIDNVIFQPLIFSNSVKAHPLEVFIVVLAAGFAAGIPGMILGIPGYTVLRVFAREFFYSFKPVQKITSGLAQSDLSHETPDNEAKGKDTNNTSGNDPGQKTNLASGD
ncbi:MAG TPA: AI-2E family transporter [Bacteroidales bacterium]|nr:AI-2E family transporter [Bacteroidales bacterium]HQM67661.1 AI-2E family transporter [Bacteroidales bacterium]